MTMAVVMAIRNVHAGPVSSTSTASMGDACSQRNGRSALKQLFFNWNAPDMNVEYLSLEMEVTNILQTETYEPTEEEKVLVVKKGITFI